MQMLVKGIQQQKMIHVRLPATLIQHKPTERIWRSSNYPQHQISITSITPCTQTELFLEVPICSSRIQAQRDLFHALQFWFTTLHADREDFITHLLPTCKTLMIHFQAYQLYTAVGLSFFLCFFIACFEEKRRGVSRKIQLEIIKHCSIFQSQQNSWGVKGFNQRTRKNDFKYTKCMPDQILSSVIQCNCYPVD